MAKHYNIDRGHEKEMPADPEIRIQPKSGINEAKIASQGLMLQNRIQKRFKHLKKWAKRIDTDVFRLYDRDIPEIPLVIDLYGNGISGALYKRPYQKDEAEEHYWLDVMAKAVSASLDIPLDHIFLKQRQRQQGKAQYHKFQNTHFMQNIHEGGLTFQVNLSDYLDTGFFPDRRKIRALLRNETKGKKVLNLFCYTGSFSVYAASGGAAEIDSVDISNTYLDWGIVNFDLNHFKTQRLPYTALADRKTKLPPYRFIREEVCSFLTKAAHTGLSWDIIILDPPSFSNSKKMTGVLDLQRDHKTLIAQSLSLLTKGGKLWFSANTKHFRLDTDDFPQVTIKNVQNLICDEDFRGKKMPICYTFEK